MREESGKAAGRQPGSWVLVLVGGTLRQRDTGILAGAMKRMDFQKHDGPGCPGPCRRRASSFCKGSVEPPLSFALPPAFGTCAGLIHLFLSFPVEEGQS